MFLKDTYINRRNLLKKRLGSGILLFMGNDECGMNYEDNTYLFRQDSTFLYFWGLSYAGLTAIINIDEDKEIIFGDELTIDQIVWMGTQPSLREKSESVGVRETQPHASIKKLSGQSCFERAENTLFTTIPCRTQAETDGLAWC